MELKMNAPKDYTGYGVTVLQLMKFLVKEGVNVQFIPQAWSQLGTEHMKPEDLDLLAVLEEQKTTDVAPIIHYGLPNYHKKVGKEKHIQFTLWEVSHIPPEWTGALNTMDLILTTTNDAKEAMVKSGVRAPISVIPLGIDTGFYRPIDANWRFRDDKSVVLKYFTFISVFEWNIRKGYDVLIPAFEEEFKGENVNLLIRTYSHNNLHDPTAGINRIRKDKKSKIFLMKKAVPDYMMPMLYNACDALVLPTRGEGWGMPVLEAMACNKPTVVTETCGIREFHPDAAERVKTTKKQLGKHQEIYEWFRGWMEWDEPDKENLKYKMRACYEGKFGKFRNHAKKFTWKKSAQAVIEAVDNIES